MNIMKYILVTGGVISGIGKGVIASSIGTILKAGGIRTTSIKIDPSSTLMQGLSHPMSMVGHSSRFLTIHLQSSFARKWLKTQ